MSHSEQQFFSHNFIHFLFCLISPQIYISLPWISCARCQLCNTASGNSIYIIYNWLGIRRSPDTVLLGSTMCGDSIYMNSGLKFEISSRRCIHPQVSPIVCHPCRSPCHHAATTIIFHNIHSNCILMDCI